MLEEGHFGEDEIEESVGFWVVEREELLHDGEYEGDEDVFA